MKIPDKADSPNGIHAIGVYQKGHMTEQAKPGLARRAKTLIIGGAKSPHDKTVLRKLSLIAFFA